MSRRTRPHVPFISDSQVSMGLLNEHTVLGAVDFLHMF